MNKTPSFMLRVLFFCIIISLCIFSKTDNVSGKWTDVCGGELGWSSWYSMNLIPNQIRTVYWSPKQAGEHKIEIKTSNPGIIVTPKWIEGSSSGTWGPFIILSSVPLTIPLSTGSSGVEYEFLIEKTSGSATTVSVRTYCGITR